MQCHPSPLPVITCNQLSTILPSPPPQQWRDILTISDLPSKTALGIIWNLHENYIFFKCFFLNNSLYFDSNINDLLKAINVVINYVICHHNYDSACIIQTYHGANGDIFFDISTTRPWWKNIIQQKDFVKKLPSRNYLWQQNNITTNSKNVNSTCIFAGNCYIWITLIN